jgi:LAGLIDADG DNA endonuclease family
MPYGRTKYLYFLNTFNKSLKGKVQKKLATSFRQFNTIATNNKDLKSKIILSNIQKDIIIGTILGDSSLERYGRSINTRLRIDQTFPQHAEYTMHLFSHLINLCGKGFKVYIRKPDIRNNKIYSSIQFKTLALPSLNFYKDLFYKDGKKIIPANISDLLIAKALAY